MYIHINVLCTEGFIANQILAGTALSLMCGRYERWCLTVAVVAMDAQASICVYMCIADLALSPMYLFSVPYHLNNINTNNDTYIYYMYIHIHIHPPTHIYTPTHPHIYLPAYKYTPTQTKKLLEAAAAAARHHQPPFDNSM